VDGLRVSELAERAGVAPSTVRFHERAGLLSPARRAANGYRVFDESALNELAFISRAKGIGMSLEDIADLVASWPAGECRSLQARLRAYLAGRISQVRQQAAEMGMFERQLQAVLDRLSASDPGPSTAGGMHLRGRSRPGPRPGSRRPATWGCSLDSDALASRTAQWRALAAAATSVERGSGTARLMLPADPEMIAAVPRCARQRPHAALTPGSCWRSPPGR
jgi:MerR family transcriptional regulator, copper efflux regulator